MFHTPAHKQLDPAKQAGQIVNGVVQHQVKAPRADFAVSRFGGIVSFTPLSDDAKSWLRENVRSEGWQWLGPTLNCEYGVGLDLLRVLVEVECFEVV